MRTLILALVLVVSTWCGAARAAPQLEPASTPWFQGLVVQQVTLWAPEGGLPDENLEPLLRMRQGEKLSLPAVRQDIALLYRAGAFSSVEAYAEPWVDIGPDDEPIDVVRLVYVVRPSPRVVAIELPGLKAQARRAALSAVDVDLGDPYFAQDGKPTASTAEAVRSALAAEGWPLAEVMVRVEPRGDNQLAVVIEVELGEPRLVGPVSVGGGKVRDVSLREARELAEAGKHVVPERLVRRWMRRSGVRQGQRVRAAALQEARDRVRDELLERGWLDARVSLVFFPEPRIGAGDPLRVQVETSEHLELVTGGRGLPGDQRVREILGIQAGERLTSGTVDESRRRLEQYFADRGYEDAKVEVGLERVEAGARMTIGVRRGPRHMLRTVVVDGADTVSAGEVRGVLEAAAPDSLGRGRYSAAGLDDALGVLGEYYRGRGLLSARVELRDVQMEEPRWLAPRRLLTWGAWTDVRIEVVEGPETILSALDLVGAPELGLAELRQAREELVGAPYRPKEVEALTRELVNLHQESGYLSADGRTDVRLSSDGSEAQVQIVVTPGDEVRLRSVIVQGNQRTRREVIERRIALDVGDPITPSALQDTRSQLYELDVFRTVSTDLVGDDERSRDLLLGLEERRNILVQVGGGVATDEGISARARTTHRNVGGRAHQARALGQVGYEWLQDDWRLDVAEPVWKAALGYEAPDLPLVGQRLVAELLINEVIQEPTFRLSRVGLSVGVRRTRDKLELALDYRAQARRLEDIDPGAIVNGDPWRDALGVADDPTLAPQVPSDWRYVSGPRLVALADLRDDGLDPRDGTLLSATVATSDGLIEGAGTVLAEGRIEHLVPAGGFVLALKASGGVGFAAGRGTTLPVEDRFRLGGSATLRGYRLDSVGPANQVARPDVGLPPQLDAIVEGSSIRSDADHWVPTGGDNMLLASFELRMPLVALGLGSSDSTALVLFTDVGHVGFWDSTIVTTSRLVGDDPFFRPGIGGGLRISTPVGPASLVVGLNPEPDTDRGEVLAVTHFSLGTL